MELRTVCVGAPELDDSGHRRLTGPAPRIARQLNRTTGGSVVTAVGREHFVTSGVNARHAHRVLGCLGSAVREEDHVQVTWGHFADEACCLAAGVVGVDRRDGAQTVGLFFDRRHELRVLMADVDIHQLAREVEIPTPGIVPEPGSLAARDDDWVDQTLCRPRMKDVFAIVGEGVGRTRFENCHEPSLEQPGGYGQPVVAACGWSQWPPR